MNVGESIAVGRVIDWLANPDSDPEGATTALGFLAGRADACLHAGRTETEVPGIVERLTGRLAAADSDGAAQAVCRGLDTHVVHGGTVPWPTVRRPFEEWQAIQARQAALDAFVEQAEGDPA